MPRATSLPRSLPLGGRARGLARDSAGVSELVSSLLLIAITVVMAGGLATLIFHFPGPQDTLHADLTVSLARGGAAWGTGDEEVVLTHQGGETLERVSTRILVEVRGVTTAYEGGGLGSAFTDGFFRIGEEWRAQLNIPQGAQVRVNVVGPNGLVASIHVEAA